MISIVDDDQGIRRALAALMQSAGMIAEVFANAEDFLASGKLEETLCLILDVHLPRMSGLELQQYLVEIGKRVPIVFISARECEWAKSLALGAGASAFLAKPISGGMLLASVRSAIKS